MTAVDRVPDELYDAYILDMDGTVYLGDELLPGAKELILELRARGIPVRFRSNNPTKDPRAYADRLDRLGIPTPVEEIASYDRSFTYEKLQIAFDAIWFHRCARSMTTNPDRYCPFPGGRGEPDAASIVAAIEASTGTRCERNFGKPDAAMLEAALSELGVSVSRAIMVGDRLSTDIRMAVDAGMVSALVLTGDPTMKDVLDVRPEIRPTFVLDRVDRLIPGLLPEA